LKKTFIIFIILSSFCGYSQNFGGGFYFGLSTSQINGDNLGGYNLPGLNIGGFTDYNFSERSKIQLELAFLQKGARDAISDSSSFNKVRLNYLEIPLIYSYRWNQLSLEIGPALDILINSKEESNGFEIESNPPYYNFSLSGIVGLNWRFTNKISISFRTNNSISLIREANVPVGTGPNAIQILSPGQRNLCLNFALIYKLI
tara:strand:- start:935 stop:1540 length:606 start_codon:yes stop_codon:yes gene_type:complete